MSAPDNFRSGLAPDERAKLIVQRGGSLMIPGDHVDVTFKRGELARLIEHAIWGDREDISKELDKVLEILK